MTQATETIPNPTPDFAAAHTAFDGFLQRIPSAGRIVCLHDSDADGVTAGVLWLRLMERLGRTSLVRFAPDRERNAWSQANRALVAQAQPDFLYLLDLGSQPERVISHLPTCMIDHHRPEGVPDGDTLISATPGTRFPTHPCSSGIWR